ncbi:zinc finger miz domain-containing protein [Anaeramoeba flamelloides]|uniref:Zinc finger miz domain-containing protein n=1 Tax=Anaeramoeba flamelloides TaxID=1746091 RepID=A0AAV7ZTK9_9EUKA|nr:zinc finger miz domain-containing protein [Anaeramoeba flamelloides]
MIHNNQKKNDPEETLDSKINKIRDPTKRSLFNKLKTHYHENKNVSHQTILRILFGDSLLLRPQYPPLIGPGIVGETKPLRFVVPRTRIEKIKRNFEKTPSKFCLRFLSNSEESEDKEKKDQECDRKILVNINNVSFKLMMNKPFQIDLSLFNKETNELTFLALSAMEDTVIVLQHMYQVDVNWIVNTVKLNKTVYSGRNFKEMKKLIYSSDCNSSNKLTHKNTNTNTNINRERNSNNSKRTLRVNNKRKDPNEIIEKMGENEIISLKCPFTKKKINVPARGVGCKHMQCFDLSNFLKNAEVTKKWICPECKQQITLQNLIVDGLIERILKESKNENEHYKLYPNGQWLPILIKKKSQINKFNVNLKNDFNNTRPRKRDFHKTKQFLFKVPKKVNNINKIRRTKQLAFTTSLTTQKSTKIMEQQAKLLTKINQNNLFNHNLCLKN